jgi:hypothetical protein
MKRVTEKMRYEGATIEQVHAMLADPAFREAVCDYQRVTHRTVKITQDGEAMSVTIDQGHATDRLPSFARKIAGDEIHMVQSEDWSDAAHGHIAVSIPGRPGHMKGTASLVQDAGGVTETADMEITVHVPLVGGKIEGLIAEMLVKALQAENKVGRDWLAERS